MRISDWSSDVCSSDLLANTRHHSAHLRKTVDGLVCPLRQIDDVLAIEQAFNEPIQFLEANEAILAQVDGGRLRGRAGQPERLAALLMPGQVRSEEWCVGKGWGSWCGDRWAADQ